ncbi:histidinol-phosphate transaminase [Reinekea marinisedimentorum]|uniref:Histidinol-phosphate aminotransferase n=1 Tax=Reinekea marinisedimentorum TaxID=230495 RepID=A0A4R3HY88_9GAMM|nr:histidinol-phosphate transaminase [Reinekea marinisedimentorum]TCS37633.1 histidinol-phosphate aminotransferase [Reinekea marinisedimentorum]
MTDFRDRLETAVQRWVSSDIRKLKAYQVPDSSGMIKLDAMENPYVWPQALQEQWLQELSSAQINRYPDADASALKEHIFSVMDVPEGVEVVLGNGSDELIQLIAMAVNGAGRKIMAPEPSFVMYQMVAKFLGMDYVGISLDSDFEIDLEAMLRKIEIENPAVIFLAQPNNPTGNLWGDEKLRRILEAANGLVVIDEAYTPFADADYLGWLDHYPNLLIMRTFSKVGLAGLRLGLLFGHSQWISEINKLRLPYNINVLTQKSTAFALEHYDVLLEQAQEIVRQRDGLVSGLKAIDGLTVYPSAANFVLVRLTKGSAGDVHEALKSHNILIKKLDGAHPLLENCLRINVSTGEENRLLIEALSQVMSGL